MIKEVEVAKPIELYLESLGYTVRSEVKGCDITAIKDDKLLVVECKTSFSIKLIYQAVDRQEFCDNVYVALPIIGNKAIPNRKHLIKLLKRLELGLITVTFLKTKTKVEVVLDPMIHKKRKRIKKRTSVMREIRERSGNYNVGGSVGVSLMTAYKESAITIASILNEHGSLTASELQKMGCNKKTYTILYKNHYSWFFKDTGRGKYGLTEQGKSALKSLVS